MGGSVGVPNHRDPLGVRDDSTQKLQLFGAELGLQYGQSRDVPTGPGEARDVAEPDWVCVQDKDNGNRRRGLFDRLHEDRTPCQDQVHVESNQIGREVWEATRVALGPAVFERNILPFDPAELAQALTEGLQPPNFYWVCSFDPQQADAGNLCRLLRLGGERHSEDAPAHLDDEGSPVHYSMI